MIDTATPARQFVIKDMKSTNRENTVTTLSPSDPVFTVKHGKKTRYSYSMATIYLYDDVICSHPIQYLRHLIHCIHATNSSTFIKNL